MQAHVSRESLGFILAEYENHLGRSFNNNVAPIDQVFQCAPS